MYTLVVNAEEYSNKIAALAKKKKQLQRHAQPYSYSFILCQAFGLGLLQYWINEPLLQYFTASKCLVYYCTVFSAQAVSLSYRKKERSGFTLQCLISAKPNLGLLLPDNIYDLIPFHLE